MKHRADIDGLRALAVVPVVLFHAGVGGLPGGFLGVDIFFVISGYLITAIVVTEQTAGRFSFWEFYRRRAVRLLPALLAMIALTLAVAMAVMLPLELRALTRSAVAAAAFAANFYFWRTADYFGGALEAKPLLHTWSLGVEEQFYLVYPAALLLVRRFAPDRLPLALALVAVASLTASAMLVDAYPQPTFYLLPTRGWELALGGLVALGILPKTRDRIRQIAAMVGLVLVALAFALTPATTGAPFPAALAPCLGATLLLGYGAGGISARLLSLTPLRWLGLISYSLYLWHWPILSLYRITHGAVLSAGATLGLLAAILGAATLSYHVIEQPFRRRRWPARRTIALALGASGAMAAVALLAGASVYRITAAPLAAIRIERYVDYPRSAAFERELRPSCPVVVQADPAGDPCLRLDPNRRAVLVLGDSHSWHIWAAIQRRYPDVQVLSASAIGCRPLLRGPGSAGCRALMLYAWQVLIATGRVQGVVLAGRWQDGDLPQLAPTIRAIAARGIRVTVVGPVVEYNGDVPELLARAIVLHDRGWFDRARRLDRAAMDRRVAALVATTPAHYYSIYRQECPGGRCRILTRIGAPIHFDYGHFTAAGAREMVAALPPV